MPDHADTPSVDDLLARADALVAAATPGPWGWRGHDDGCVELTTLHSGGLRVVSAMRAEPCIVTLDDGDPALTMEACDSCRAKWAESAKVTDSTLVWENYRCPKPENLGTVWLWSEPGFVRPANYWAERERPYRSDVARVDHPDAELIAAAPDLIRELAAALRAKNAETRSATALARDLESAFDNMEADLARVDAQLAEAHDRLDENEGTIAALRHQLADAEARAATPQPDDDIGPLDDETRRAALEQLSTKRAAAPQPLWRGTRAGLRMINLQASYSEVPAYTRLAIYRDDQTPPGVTREQLHDAVHAALHPWMYPEDMAGDEAAAEEFEEAVPQVTDRLMALIHGEGT